MKEKKIYRPTDGRMFFGVAAGIANYFQIDPVIVRLVFVILTVSGGAGIILYIIGVFIIPEEEGLGKTQKKVDFEDRVEKVAEEIGATVKNKATVLKGEQIFGLILILVGLVFLMQRFIPWLTFDRFWPLILILIGLVMILDMRKEKK